MKTPREIAQDEVLGRNIEHLATVIEEARMDDLLEAYAALVGLRTRYSMTEMADALERACTVLGLDLDRVRDRIG